jgi:hypothetical protein
LSTPTSTATRPSTWWAPPPSTWVSGRSASRRSAG